MPEETWELTAATAALKDRPPGERRRRSRAKVPALTILYHPDLRRVGEVARLSELLAGGDALLSRLEPGFAPPGSADLRPLDDRHVSRSPLLLAPADGGSVGGIRLALGASRTAVLADQTPVTDFRVFPAQEVDRGVVLELSGRVVLLLHHLPAVPFHEPERFGLIGDSEALTRVRHEIRRVADLDLPVLLRGETGTGKELVAQAIHQASRRRGGPWLSINMGAIPPTLAASELFGAVKGAYTGAVQDQIGYFQRAHGGTLFLDEIGEAPAEVQVMLLRVLETGEVQRLGSREPQRVDTRLVAATDADLEQAIRDGRFREPLLHRLSGYELTIPPLRQRRDDLGRLLFAFLRQELRPLGEEHRLDPAADPSVTPWMPASVVARLARYGWPGNVRQLRNTVRQLVVASRGTESVQIPPQIERLLRECEPHAAASVEAGPAATPPPGPLAPRKRAEPGAYRAPSDVTEEELLETLRANRWQIKLTAAQLGISRPSLYMLMDRFKGIRKAADLSRAEILECRDACGGDLEAMVSRLEVSPKGLQQRMRQLGIE
jgi:two-component system nitrogen regulation response regulator GlnG